MDAILHYLTSTPWQNQLLYLFYAGLALALVVRLFKLAAKPLRRFPRTDLAIAAIGITIGTYLLLRPIAGRISWVAAGHEDVARWIPLGLAVTATALLWVATSSVRRRLCAGTDTRLSRRLTAARQARLKQVSGTKHGGGPLNAKMMREMRSQLGRIDTIGDIPGFKARRAPRDIVGSPSDHDPGRGEYRNR